ncbi:MAG: hypothetical protein ACTTH7_01280 [Treponema sp.]
MFSYCGRPVMCFDASGGGKGGGSFARRIGVGTKNSFILKTRDDRGRVRYR